MSLTLITGPPNCGKSGHVRRTLTEALGRGDCCALLLPSWAEVERATAEYAVLAPVGLLVSPLNRYLLQRWLIEGDGRRLVSDAEREALISSVLQAKRDDPAVFEQSPGLVRMLARIARSPVRTSGTRAVSREAGEAVNIIRQYRRRLDELRLVEPSEALALLSRAPAPAHDLVVVHRFARLAQQESAYLVSLSKHADVLLTLTWEQDSPATEALTPIVQALEAEGAKHIRVGGEDHTSSADLRALASRVFRTASEPLGKPEDVRFVECESLERELVRAAAEAAAAIASGIPAENVAIVFRDAWPKVRPLQRALLEFGLVSDVDVETPLLALTLARSIAQLLRFAVLHTRQDLVAWLRSPYSGLEPAAVDAAEVEWRQRREARPAVWSAAIDARSAAAGRMISLATELALQPLDASWAESFDELIALHLTAAHGRDARLLGPGAEEDVRAVRELSGVVGRAAESGVVRMGVQELLMALESRRIAPERTERPGHVQIASVQRVRSRRFSAVILGGLTSDEFPRADRDDALTAGAGGEAARALGLPPTEVPDAAERADFYAVITRPRDRLVLLTHTATADGDACAPSTFWSEALEVYTSRDAEDERPPFVEEDRPSRPTVAPRTLPSFAQRLNAEGQVPEALTSRDTFSPGELERYAACPARWLHDYGLKPRSVDVEFDALTRGALAHDVLRQTLTELRELGHDRVTTASLPDALRISARLLDDAAASLPEGAALRERYLMTTTRAMVESFLRADAAFVPHMKPLHLEWSFGSSDDPASAFELGPGIRITGRVDRIDIGGDVALVSDYKAGEIASFKSLSERGLLQLPLYALAARDKGIPVVGAVYRSLKTGKLSGFHLADAFSAAELPGSQGLTAGAFEALLTDAASLAIASAEGIRAGRVAPAAAKHACDYCPARAYCGEGR